MAQQSKQYNKITMRNLYLFVGGACGTSPPLLCSSLSWRPSCSPLLTGWWVPSHQIPGGKGRGSPLMLLWPGQSSWRGGGGGDEPNFKAFIIFVTLLYN